MVFAVSASLATPSRAAMSALDIALPREGAAVLPLLLVDMKFSNQLWYSLPELFRFFVSGNFGNLCFFLIERGLFAGIERIPSPPTFLIEHQDSASFIVGYILQIVTQHLLHAWLVYGLHTISTRDKYLKTLSGQAGAYFTALIGSTVLNIFLRRRGMTKNAAFVTTLYLFACINYYVIGWITRRSVEPDNVPPNQSLNTGIVPETSCVSNVSFVMRQRKAIRRGGACETATLATNFQHGPGADVTWPGRVDSDLLYSQQISSSWKKFS